MQCAIRIVFYDVLALSERLSHRQWFFSGVARLLVLASLGVSQAFLMESLMACWLGLGLSICPYNFIVLEFGVHVS